MLARVLFIGLGLLAVLAIVVLGWRGAGPVSPTSPASHAGDRGPGRAALPAAAPADDGAERMILPAAGVDPSGPTRVRVLVVDDATGAPVGGAEVVGPYDLPAPSWRDDLAAKTRIDVLGARGVVPDWNAAARAAGLVTVAGPDGVAWVALPAVAGDTGSARIEAESGARFARAWVARSSLQAEAEITLRLKPTVDLVVEVVDAEGAPVAGVTLDWCFTTSSPRRAPAERDEVVVLGFTGDDGRATYRHFGALRDASVRDGAVLTASGVTARVCGALVEPVPIPEDLVPGEPVRIVLPPTGGLRIELPGGTMNFDSQLSIGPEPTRGGREDRREFLVRGPGDVEQVGNLEVVAFAPVGVGAVVRVLLREWNNEALIDAVVPGPTRPGEVATVRLVPNAPVLVGTLVDRVNAPLARRDAYVFVGAGGVQREYDGRTDDDGRFRIPVDHELVGLEEPWIRFQLQGQGPGVAHVSPTRPLAAGMVDLGAVAVEAMPLLASGRCVDETGAPIPGAGVGIGSGDEAEGSGWRGIESVRDDDGRFELYGAVPVTSLTLTANAPRHLRSEPRVIAAGSTDLVFVLRQAGNAIATTASVPSQGDLRARLIRGDRTAIDGQGQDLPGGEVRWTWLWIEPGRYRFELRTAVNGAVLFAVDDVEVRGGETTRDPRLTGIEVEGVESFRLRVHDGDGGPLPGAGELWGSRWLWSWSDGQAHLFFRGVDDSYRGRRFEGAETWVNAEPAPQRLLIAVPGHRAAFVSWTGGDLDVRVTRAPRVVVRVPADARIDTIALRGGPPMRLRPYQGLDSDIGELDRWPGMTARAVEDGTAVFEVPAPGRYAVELMGMDAGAFEPTFVDVPDAPQVEVELARRE